MALGKHFTLSASVLNEVVSGLTEKGTFEKGLGGEGVSCRDIWGGK